MDQANGAGAVTLFLAARNWDSGRSTRSSVDTAPPPVSSPPRSAQRHICHPRPRYKAWTRPFELWIGEILCSALLTPCPSIDRRHSELCSFSDPLPLRPMIWASSWERHHGPTGQSGAYFAPNELTLKRGERFLDRGLGSVRFKRSKPLPPTSWKWQVTPTKEGIQTLQLDSSAHIDVAGHDTPLVVKTFSRDIQVTVTMGSRFWHFVRTNWQWLWAALGVPTAAYFLRRKKNA